MSVVEVRAGPGGALCAAGPLVSGLGRAGRCATRARYDAGPLFSGLGRVVRSATRARYDAGPLFSIWASRRAATQVCAARCTTHRDEILIFVSISTTCARMSGKCSP